MRTRSYNRAFSSASPACDATAEDSVLEHDLSGPEQVPPGPPPAPPAPAAPPSGETKPRNWLLAALIGALIGALVAGGLVAAFGRRTTT